MSDKSCSKTMWWIILPLALLIFILGGVTGASLKIAHPHTNIAEIKLNATMNMIRNEMESDYNFLSQQQMEIQNTSNQLKTLSTKANSADLANAIANLQNQANQLNTQRQHLVAFMNELTQFNADIKNKNNP